MYEQCSLLVLVWKYHILPIHQLMDIWIVQFGAVTNCYELLHGCLCVDTFSFLLSGYTGVGLLGCIVTNFLRKCQIASRSGCTVFTFPLSICWLQPLSPH